jgi:hypothetical protein
MHDVLPFAYISRSCEDPFVTRLSVLRLRGLHEDARGEGIDNESRVHE